MAFQRRLKRANEAVGSTFTREACHSPYWYFELYGHQSETTSDSGTTTSMKTDTKTPGTT